MELKRKAYDELLAWKNSDSGSRAILIKGARRVGKSYLAEHFARNEYRSYILIDFASPVKGTKKIFEDYGNKYRLNDFFNHLSVLYGTPLFERDSLIVFDEVQKYPKARELIKYLVEDGRYDYLETGSLITIRKNVKDIVIPSEEDVLLLYPLDFEEFLWAQNDTVTVPFLKQAFLERKPLGNLLKPVMEKLRNYMLVGGMPQAVKEFVNSGNIDRVEKIKRSIIDLYTEDIAKYADNYVAEATAVFRTIPEQLSHHDKKIKYSSLESGDRFTCYRDALYWIADSMVGNLCVGTDEPAVFGEFTVQPSKVKCYMGDTGLLLTMAAGKNYLHSELYRSFMLGKLSVNQGMLTENLVAQMLTAGHHSLRFYEKWVEEDAGRKKYEIDFLITQGEKTMPLEVKSGSSRNHPSLDFYTARYKRQTGEAVILTKGDLRVTEPYTFLPIPMAMFL